MTDKENLIKTEIKVRHVTYYLTSIEDLRNLKNNSLLGDFFAVLTSIAIGGIISVLLTKATGIELQKETIKILIILFWVFFTIAWIFGLFAIYFYRITYRSIKIIKESGEVKSFKNVEQIENTEKNPNPQKEIILQNNKLEIIKAIYWTLKAKSDVTDELRHMIVNNKLETIASNQIKDDPDPGTAKKLSIEYKFNGIIVAKDFIEDDKVVIP